MSLQPPKTSCGGAQFLRVRSGVRQAHLRGCKLLVGLLILTLLVLVAILFVASLRLGLVGLAIILLHNVLAVVKLSDLRGCCPKDVGAFSHVGALLVEVHVAFVPRRHNGHEDLSAEHVYRSEPYAWCWLDGIPD